MFYSFFPKRSSTFLFKNSIFFVRPEYKASSFQAVFEPYQEIFDSFNDFIVLSKEIDNAVVRVVVLKQHITFSSEILIFPLTSV
jgi:hypothetical protein